MRTHAISEISLALFLVLGTFARGCATPNAPNRRHTGVLSAEVVDASGRPVSGAKVNLMDSVTGEMTSIETDDKGQCRLIRLFPGTYGVRAEKGDTQSDSQGIKISNGATTTVKLVLGSNKN